jgi:hypothetical protein
VTFWEAAIRAWPDGKITAEPFQDEYVIIPGDGGPFRWNPESPENGQPFVPSPEHLEYEWHVMESKDNGN